AAPRAYKPAWCGIVEAVASRCGGRRPGPTPPTFGCKLVLLCLFVSAWAAGRQELSCAGSADWSVSFQQFFLAGGSSSSGSSRYVTWRCGARACGPALPSWGASSWEAADGKVEMAAPDAAQQQQQAAFVEQQRLAALAAAGGTVEQAARAAAEQVATAASQQRRNEQLARLVQKPDLYKPETRDQETDQWADWRFSFVSYLGVVDSKFVEEIEWVEAHASTEKAMVNMDPSTQGRARELYAVLLSFVRNRPAKLVRAVPQQNGYEAWRQLMVEMMPSSRQRQLALVTQLTSTRLDPRRSLSEQLGKYEELIREYERVAGTRYAEDLMISTLVSAAPAALQAQLHMSLGPDTTYLQVRDKILLYERSTARWQSGTSLAMPSLHTGDTATPMEVDRVEKGGKKGKGKKDCWNAGANPKGKGKGNKVRQVQEQSDPQTPVPPSSASTTSSTAPPSVSSAGQHNKGVRMVRMVTPPTAPILEVYDMASDPGEEINIEYAVRAVTVLKYKGACLSSGDAATEGKECEIILDSGADASMIPESFGHLGEEELDARAPQLTDAQGNRIASSGVRKCEFMLEDEAGQRYLIRESCVVGPVRSLPARVPAIDLPKEVLSKVGDPGMHSLGCGWKLHYSPGATTLLDGREWFDADYWSCRTTFLQTDGGKWLQVENSSDYSYEDSPYGMVSREPVARVTLFNMTPFDDACFPGGLEPKASERGRYEPSPASPPRLFLGRPGDYMEDSSQAAGEGQASSSGQVHQPDAAPGEPDEDDEAMGAPPAGLTQEELESYIGTWAAKAAEEDTARPPREERAPDAVPDADAQARHRLTHVPFASWCASCVKTRSRDDHHRRNAHDNVVPVVQVDFYYTKVDTESRPNPEAHQEPTNLIAVDLQTRMVLSVPGPDKGPGMLRQAAEELTRFTVSLHGEETITMQSDGEPSIKSLVRSVAAARQRLGKRTNQRTTPVGDHAANGAAERAIQTVRRLGNCFAEAFEERAGKLSVGSHLRVWVQGHAAFIYNRFHVLPGLNKTPFELAYGGKLFEQKLCEFGEVVYGRVLRKYKGEVQWIKGVWCGINPHNGAHRLMSTFGHIECNAVRRGTAEVQMTVAEIEKEMFGLPWEHGVVEKRRQAKRRQAPTAIGAPVLTEPAGLIAPPTPATPGRASQGVPATPALSLAPPTPAEPLRAGAGAGDEAGSDPPTSSAGSSSEDELLAAAEASPSGVKRKAEKEQAAMARPKQAPAADTRTQGTKRKPEDDAEEPGDGPSIRLVETVDAEWHDVTYEVKPVVGEILEVGGHGEIGEDMPPDLAATELAELDEAAEIAEIERLEQMGVLLPDLGEPDAYLTVEQPEDEPVVITSPASWYKRHGTHKQWKLGRVLPGQRRGAQEWYSKFNRDLRANHLEPMLEAPTLYRHLAGQFAAQLHVDDMLSSGVAELGEPLYANLKEQYTVKIAGPFSKPGDEFEFLKRRYCIEENGSITVRPALRFYYDIWELAGKPKTRSTPGPQDMVFGVDDSELLKSNQATDFRTIVGKLLYISNERPDAQVVIQYLASRASSPTVTSKRVVEHLAGYLWATQGHGINLCPCQGRSVMRAEGSSDPGGDQPPGHSSTAKHLIEAVSDSNFANDKATRRSLSSGQLYVNGALAFSFVRSQKVVTTSSGEAELVALTQTVGEAVLLRKALAFLEGVRDVDVELVARTDSSVARAIAARSGVGRVKHLATSCLWLQGWVARKELRVAAIPTEVNPADVGTKVLAARRLAMLLFILGMVGENGERVGRREFEERATRQGLRQRNVMRLAQMLVAMQLQGCSGESEGTADTVEGILVKFAFFLEYVMTMIAGNPEIMLCIAVVVLFLAALFVGSQFQWTLKLEVSNNKGLEPATK
ncbi:unnamed protein product, partial [Symbiodinium microadriaticum]